MDVCILQALGAPILQYFVRGCDAFIDKTLQGGIHTIEDCEAKTLAYQDSAENMDVSADVYRFCDNNIIPIYQLRKWQ